MVRKNSATVQNKNNQPIHESSWQQMIAFTEQREHNPPPGEPCRWNRADAYDDERSARPWNIANIHNIERKQFMFTTGMRTFREFAMAEELSLATIQEAVLEFLRDRDDVVVFGAQAVNAYVDEPRMTQDVDLISIRAEAFAEELRNHLHEQFHIAIRVRQVAGGRGFRLFQIRKEGNRHLVDIRAADALPTSQRIAQVLVMSPAELVATKVISYHQRRGRPKSGTDWRDIALLLLEFPDLKQKSGPVETHLREAQAEQTILDVWYTLVEQEIAPEDDDDEFAW